ncbi:helix-turn-helix domain-containing protein [Kitasatospora sp. NPDC049285]|uniref:helix-turn-helix domain-containing protein n=1 Tax=Kitasatospora sp. NPDC049285 TaxID=3157096 RepID=UPI0034359DC4
MYVTTGQTATALGCSIPTVRKLLATGVIPGVLEHGRQIVPQTALHELQHRSGPDLSALRHPEVAVLRTGSAEHVGGPDGGWSGFGTELTEGQLLAALSGWWRCDPARVAAAAVLPVTVAGFVVAVLTGLEDWTADGTAGTGARYQFTGARLAGYLTDLTHPANRVASAPAGTDDRRLADLLLGTRLPSQSSGPIAYVSTRTATDQPTEGE